MNKKDVIDVIEESVFEVDNTNFYNEETEEFSIQVEDVLYE